LRRIRNQLVEDHFARYDSNSNVFVPKEMLAYEYPNDVEQYGDQPLFSKEVEQTALSVLTGVQELADHMTSVILGYTSAPEARRFKLLAFFLERMRELARGDVILAQDRLSAGEVTGPKLASLHVQQLLNFIVEISDLLRQRNLSKMSERPVNFSLGDIVVHKHFGFRGVVVGWDPKPSVDVSRWDGLQHIKDPHLYPFYHIIPDHDDCIEAFGGKRHSRYVCEANLETCPPDRSDLSADMDPHWTFDSHEKVYIPPDDMKVSAEKTMLCNFSIFTTIILTSFLCDSSSSNMVKTSTTTESQNNAWMK
jgi:hemimethylated DNA binding protein